MAERIPFVHSCNGCGISGVPGWRDGVAEYCDECWSSAH